MTMEKVKKGSARPWIAGRVQHSRALKVDLSGHSTRRAASVPFCRARYFGSDSDRSTVRSKLATSPQICVLRSIV